VAVVRQVEPTGKVIKIPAAKPIGEGMPCPKCNDGKLVKRKAKTEFLGWSNYPKCKFTDYRDQPA